MLWLRNANCAWSWSLLVVSRDTSRRLIEWDWKQDIGERRRENGAKKGRRERMGERRGGEEIRRSKERGKHSGSNCALRYDILSTV
jgi:hypothetical protein